MMNLKIFLAKIMNAMLTDEIITDLKRENTLGYSEIDIATMKYNIRKDVIDIRGDISDPKSELSVMVNKSLAFLIKFDPENEPAVIRHTGFSIDQLNALFGKKLTTEEYENILNQ